MLYNNVCLEKYGYEIPELAVSSDELEQRISPLYDRLDLAYGRLEMISGIKERRYWKEGTMPSKVSALAGEKAIRGSGIAREDIGCLVNASVCRDYLEPSTASVVHQVLGLPKSCLMFDVTNACLGFADAILIVANMIELGQIKAGLIVAGECANALLNSTVEELNNNSSITRKKLKSHFSSLTIGSGAAALILTHSSCSAGGHKLLGGVYCTDTAHIDLCLGQVNRNGETLMYTDSSGVLENGIELAVRTWNDFKKELNWTKHTAEKIFCHQVGVSHRKMLFEALEMDIKKVLSTLEYLGNTGSVSMPISMAIGIEKGLVKKGDKVVMMGIGTGLNCVMLGVEW